jgi:hypothetical protein
MRTRILTEHCTLIATSLAIFPTISEMFQTLPISQNQTSHSKALIWEKDRNLLFQRSYIQHSTTRNQQTLHLLAYAQANEISNF